MSSGQVVKWGNSLAVRIPKPIAQQAGVGEGDSIVLEAEQGQIRLMRKDAVPTLKELVSQITRENRYAEIALGSAQGKEKVEW